MKVRLSVLIAATALLATGVVLAQESTPAASPIRVPSPDEHAVDMHTLLNAVAGRTHKRFLVDPRSIRSIDLGTMTLQDVDYATLLSLLSLNDLMAIETSNGVDILPDASARQSAIRTFTPKTINAPDSEWITVTMPVKNLSAAQLVPILRPLMPQNALLAAVTGRNALLIVDRAANVKRLIALIEGLEALPPEPTHDN